MKLFFQIQFLLVISLSVYGQDHDRDTKSKFYGLSDDVVKLEEISYSFNETDSVAEKIQYQVLDFSNGKLTKDRTEYFGEYPSVVETTNTYGTKGQLLKKEIKDLTYNTTTIYSYSYDKDKLISDTYQTDYSSTSSIYKYDTKGRLIKKEVKNQDGTDANYTDYSDYGSDNETYTEKYYFYGDSGISLLGTAKYEKGLLKIYESTTDYFGFTKNEYTHDQFGNVLSSKINDEISGASQYHYIDKNYTKMYSTEIYEGFTVEEFKFRKITFKNGKTIGSTEPDMNFIYLNNVVDEEYDDEFGGENLAELLNGECVAGDCQNGYGTEKYDAGQTYEGFFKDAQRHGTGVLDYGDGSSYNGAWENGVKNGLGMYNNGDGNYFLGYHKNDLRHGYGFEQNVLDNGEYEFIPSMWEDGNLIEEFSFAPTQNETGCINGDCNNGHGRMVFDNGDVYLGYFKNGKFDKFGVYVYKIGDTYIGGYLNHEKSGIGMYVWADKTVYVGNYQNDTYNGLGAYLSNQENANLIGEFKDGKLIKSME